MKNRQVYFFRAGVMLAAAGLAGCGGAGAVHKDDGSLVEARALERWNLLIAHQAEKAYDYLTPGFRQTITRAAYAEQKNDVAVRWKSARVSGHQCDADSCTVTVMVDTQVHIPGVGAPQSAPLPTEEHWIKVDRSWYYLPDTRIKALPVAPGTEPAADGKPAGQKQPD